MPNPLAYLILLIWPIVTIGLFRKLPAERAFLASLLVGYLFLPEPPAEFDLPLLPALDKHNIPALASFLALLAMQGPKGLILPQSWIARGLLTVFILSPIATVLSNPEPVMYGDWGLPGLTWKDAAALTINQFLLVLPFLIARRILADADNQRLILMALVTGGAVYSVLMLIEIRLSPQLNNWIYGYFQHYFGQSIRFGGYRPVVFLNHGLWVAFFMLTAVVSAFAIWRIEAEKQTKMLLFLALYLLAILVLAKSLGALIFALFLVPAVIFFGRLFQIKVALILGLLAIGYPLMKGADLIPEERLLERIEQISPDRRDSLAFRFGNEQTLLDRAYLKPVFGWGSWGRNHVHDRFTRRILTTTDGRWIIVIGTLGWIGYLAEFGLLVLPILLLARESLVFRKSELSPYIAPLSLILAINVFDLLPNATLTPLTWLIAGALLGYAEKLRAERLQQGHQKIDLTWKPILK